MNCLWLKVYENFDVTQLFKTRIHLLAITIVQELLTIQRYSVL